MRAAVSSLAVLLIALPGCMDGEKGTKVEVDDNYFRPSSAPAKVGDVFEFENEGQIDHTVTIHRPPDGATTYLKDDVVKPGQETQFTFDKQGTYHVFCRYHGSIGSRMHLNVTVSA